MRVDLMLSRLDLIEASLPSVDYCKRVGIDFASTVAGCGGVFLAEVQPDRNRFEPREGGILAAWCDAIAEDGETVVDVTAWATEQPERWWTLSGFAPALGLNHAVNPASYAFGSPLRFYRTPERWLQAGCNGAVVLDRARGARWLLDLPPGRWAAEDQVHAAEIAASMRDLFDFARIVVPKQPRAA